MIGLRRGIARAGWIALVLWETRILLPFAIALRRGDYISESDTNMLWMMAVVVPIFVWCLWRGLCWLVFRDEPRATQPKQ
jgi:Na+/glutamate symporter